MNSHFAVDDPLERAMMEMIHECQMSYECNGDAATNAFDCASNSQKGYNSGQFYTTLSEEILQEDLWLPNDIVFGL